MSTELLQAEMELHVTEQRLRAVLLAVFPRGTRVMVKAGQGESPGVIHGHPSKDERCRLVQVLHSGPLTQERRRLRKGMLFWHDYRNLRVVARAADER